MASPSSGERASTSEAQRGTPEPRQHALRRSWPHAAYPCGVSSRTPRGPQDVRVLLRRRARASPLIARRRGRPAPLRLQLDAYTRRACSCCRELAPHLRRLVDALVGELEGGDITAGDRAHIAGDLLATCRRAFLPFLLLPVPPLKARPMHSARRFFFDLDLALPAITIEFGDAKRTVTQPGASSV